MDLCCLLMNGFATLDSLVGGLVIWVLIAFALVNLFDFSCYSWFVSLTDWFVVLWGVFVLAYCFVVCFKFVCG